MPTSTALLGLGLSFFALVMFSACGDAEPVQASDQAVIVEVSGTLEALSTRVAVSKVDTTVSKLSSPTAIPLEAELQSPIDEPFSDPVEIPTSVGDLSVDDYAAACGLLMRELRAADYFFGSESDVEYRRWITRFDGLVPPAKFREFHEARIEQHLTILQSGGGDGRTQAAYDREIAFVADLSPNLRSVLLDGRCLLELEVVSGGAILAARARVADRNTFENPLTMEDYAQRCVDIEHSSPLMGSQQDYLDYTIEQWRSLNPPPGLEDYHEILMIFFDRWEETRFSQDIDPTGPLGSALAAMADEVKELGPEFIELLLRSGCTSGP